MNSVGVDRSVDLSFAVAIERLEHLFTSRMFGDLVISVEIIDSNRTVFQAVCLDVDLVSIFVPVESPTLQSVRFDSNPDIFVSPSKYNFRHNSMQSYADDSLESCAVGCVIAD